MKKINLIVFLISIYIFCFAEDFSYYPFVNEETLTLNINIVELSIETGFVEITGYIEGSPDQLMWDWGDGTAIEYSFFPNAHQYENTDIDHILTVTAIYNQPYHGFTTYEKEKYLRFTEIELNPVELEQDLLAYVPDSSILIVSRMPGYGIPDLEPFSDEDFGLWQRDDIEYMLSLAANLQFDLTNENIFLIDGAFHQFMMKDEDFGGMYSLWYTSPVIFGVGATTLENGIGWSSYFHEMGHNMTLNSPAEYYYGGKIDGCANAVFSETMAQIFQHVTGYYIINDGDEYGLPDGVVNEIRESVENSFATLQFNRDIYINGNDDPNDPWFDCEPLDFRSWNDPATPEDETLYTFMTIAYEFFNYAENNACDYRISLKLMMELLQLFDENIHNAWNQYGNSPEAEEIRSTLMIAAESYGLNADLRSHFQDLGFPVNDEFYLDLMSSVTGAITLDFPENFILNEDETESYQLSNYFWSLFGEEIQWNTQIENADVVIENDTITIIPEPDFCGYEYCTVTAMIPDLQIIKSDTFLVYIIPVEDEPILTANFQNVNMEGQDELNIDLSDHFYDPDIPYGDELNFSLTSSAEIDYVINGSNLTIYPPDVCYGFTEIGITASDTQGNSIDSEFDLNWIIDDYDDFNFSEIILGDGLKIKLNIDYIIPENNQVFINGMIKGNPDSLIWNWGDGSIENTYFPAYHTYENLLQNYLVTVTANYSNGYNNNDPISGSIYIINEAFDDEIGIYDPIVNVCIPDHSIDFGSRMPQYGYGESLGFFDDNTFLNMSRSQIESVLTTIAYIQYDLVNYDVYKPDGTFQQVVMKDAGACGLYSLWYLDPVCFGANDSSLGINIQWTSLFHEMGHNFTLNFPADFYYGGKIDGPANCLYSEIMAQIFQHASIAILLNNYEFYNIPQELAMNIRQSGESSADLLRRMYDWYCNGIYDPDTNSYSVFPLTFETWNDPYTAYDETLYTFMSAAYVFMEQAELFQNGYRDPLKRMMTLLATFDQEMADNFAQNEDSPEADSFRATLMTAAISYAFDYDLRERFRQLNYPISDQIYTDLLNRVQPYIVLPEYVTLEIGHSDSLNINDYSGNLGSQYLISHNDMEHFSITIEEPYIMINAPVNWFGSEILELEIITEDGLLITAQSTLISSGYDFGPEWIPAEYSDSAMVYYQLEVDNEMFLDNGLIASFSNNECRGVQLIPENPLTVNLDTETDLSFRFYDPVTENTYISIYQAYLEPGETAGSPDTPLIIPFSTNLAPQIVLPDTISFYEDQVYQRNIFPEIFDPDNDSLCILVSQSEFLTSAVINWDLLITPEEQWYGSDIITISVNDNQNRLITEKNLNVIVMPVNDSPYLNCNYDFTFFNTDTLTVDFSEFVFDIEGDPVTLGFRNNNAVYITVVNSLVSFCAGSGWTGSEEIVVTADDGFSEPAEEVIVVTAIGEVFGDLDLNGIVESLDAALILQYHVGLDPQPYAPLPWNDWLLHIADVDENQMIEAYDASLILQFFVGIIDSLPYNENMMISTTKRSSARN